ncbi:hypothetical protein KBI52_15325 [Microvirga sp. HBU67558]|uniref:hypothetical protein n=1 Tax=Microvirga TaxID=186650 RepID=UPI001B37DE61|nr:MULTISPECIES: hypothetical protein [unclassified Microvirga]MBQ0821570.1 hypothetical protein [Microvirga sp. HBU67558]
MADNSQDGLPQDRIPSVMYDAALLRMSWDAIARAKKLLDQTQPLVDRITGGSLIGARALDRDEGGPPGDVQLTPDE